MTKFATRLQRDLPLSLLTMALLFPITLLGQENERWDDSFGWYPIEGEILAIDAGACDMYVGGRISADAGENFVARFDGTGWSRLGEGSVDGTVHAVAVDGSDLYVGGDFGKIDDVDAGGLARWNGVGWEAIGGPVAGGESTIYDIAVFGTDIFIAGSFTSVDGVAANNIARWSGLAGRWAPLASGMDGTVFDLHVEGDFLYIGGKFSRADDNTASNIARFNLLNNTWQRLGSGLNDTVFAIEVTDRLVYAGGAFTLSGLNEANHIATFDRGTGNWSGLAGGADGAVRGLELRDSVLYAVGAFGSIGGITTTGVASWRDGAWQALGEGLDGPAYAIASCAEQICIGGAFESADLLSSPFIARWDIPGWSSLLPETGNNGLNYPARAVAIRPGSMVGELYAGGEFTRAGELTVNHLAFWNGSEWESFGDGTDGPVHALAVDAETLVIGGLFTTTSGESTQNIAMQDIDDGSWEALGGGLDGMVHTIVIDGDMIYAGGEFSQAGGTPAANLARFSITNGNWSAIGGGTNGPVHALELDGGTLHVGGEFTQAGGAATGNYATFDLAGSSWTTLTPGMNGTVRAIEAAEDGKLYVGGDFTAIATAAYNRPIDHAAVNDGDGWRGLEGGLDEGVTITTVYDIASSGESVFFGGEFTQAGGVPIGYLTRWRESWTPLGDGIDGVLPAVYGLAASDRMVAVAGNFDRAGDKPSVNIGVWDNRTVSVHRSDASEKGDAITVYRSGEHLGIRFESDRAGAAGNLTIADITGRTLHTEEIAPGHSNHHQIRIDPRTLSSGTYLLRLRIGSDLFTTTISLH